VGPTGQTPRSNRPSRFGRTEPPHTPTSLTLSLATPMATRSPAPSPACAGRLRPPLAVSGHRWPRCRHQSDRLLPLYPLTRGIKLGCSVLSSCIPSGSARVSTMVSSSSTSLGFSPWLSWASQLSTVTYGHWLGQPRGALPRWPRGPRSWLRPPLLHLPWSLAPWTSKWLHPLSLALLFL
jgi:hypothetical protein